jgi:hypothetical protein
MQVPRMKFESPRSGRQDVRLLAAQRDGRNSNPEELNRPSHTRCSDLRERSGPWWKGGLGKALSDDGNIRRMLRPPVPHVTTSATPDQDSLKKKTFTLKKHRFRTIRHLPISSISHCHCVLLVAALTTINVNSGPTNSRQASIRELARSKRKFTLRCSDLETLPPGDHWPLQASPVLLREALP